MAFLVVVSAFLFLQAVTACDVSVGVLKNAWGLIDEGETEPYALVLRNNILSESTSSAEGRLYALGATFTAISELSWVRPSSGCAYAKLINADVSGCSSSIKSAIDGYAVVLAQAADNVRILGNCCVLPSPWPVLDNCCGDYGRIYEFESSWDRCKGFPTGKARCAARDLYTSFGARANNVGAAATSAATGPALSIFKKIQGPLTKFLESASANKDGCCSSRNKALRTQAGELKAAIFKAASCVKNSL